MNRAMEPMELEMWEYSHWENDHEKDVSSVKEWAAKGCPICKVALCPECHGEGNVHEDSRQGPDCSFCDGTGLRPVDEEGEEPYWGDEEKGADQ